MLHSRVPNKKPRFVTNAGEEVIHSSERRDEALSPIQLSKVAAQSPVYLAWFLPVLVELIMPKDIVISAALAPKRPDGPSVSGRLAIACCTHRQGLPAPLPCFPASHAPPRLLC